MNGEGAEIGQRWDREGDRDRMDKGQNGTELLEIHQQSSI